MDLEQFTPRDEVPACRLRVRSHFSYGLSTPEFEGERAALADLAQDVHADRELSGKFVEDIAEGRIALSGQRRVRAFAKAECNSQGR